MICTCISQIDHRFNIHSYLQRTECSIISSYLWKEKTVLCLYCTFDLNCSLIISTRKKRLIESRCFKYGNTYVRPRWVSWLTQDKASKPLD